MQWSSSYYLHQDSPDWHHVTNDYNHSIITEVARNGTIPCAVSRSLARSSYHAIVYNHVIYFIPVQHSIDGMSDAH
jgi:hypothetical protein